MAQAITISAAISTELMRKRQPTLVSAHNQSREPKMAPSQRMPAEMPQAAPSSRTSRARPASVAWASSAMTADLGGQADVRVGDLAVAPEADGEEQQQAGQQPGDAPVERPSEPDRSRARRGR